MMAKQPKLDEFLPYLMNRLVARMNQNLGEQLRSQGYTFQNWRILAVLAAHKAVNLTELTEATVLPQPSVSRNVASLERKGLLKRRTGARDSRVVEISITPRGRTVYDRMLRMALAEDRAAMKGISRSEADALRAALHVMMKNRNVKLLSD
jgi:DNA-binding MarR family transcriptional regulator